MKDPAFLFYSADFLSGTYTMTDEQVGKYIRLLCLQHQKGYLTEKDMSHICNSYEKDIYAKFVKDDDGLYRNERLNSEMVRRKAYSDSRRNNRLGKTPKKGNHMKNICKSYEKHMGTETITETITINKTINKTKTINEIIEHLNKQTSSNYKTNSKATTRLITARLNEGYTVDDFKIVIDKKCYEWIGDEKMEPYLRPETLFGAKFESYLNQSIPRKKPQGLKGIYEEIILKEREENE